MWPNVEILSNMLNSRIGNSIELVGTGAGSEIGAGVGSRIQNQGKWNKLKY